jgi:hypothetical protein
MPGPNYPPLAALQGAPAAAPPQPQSPSLDGSLDGLPHSVLMKLARQIQLMQQRARGAPPQYSSPVGMGIRG